MHRDHQRGSRLTIPFLVCPDWQHQGLATLAVNQRCGSITKALCTTTHNSYAKLPTPKLCTKAQALVLDRWIDFQTTHWNFSNFERQLCLRSCSVGFSSVGVKQQRSPVERQYRNVSTKQTSKKKKQKTNLETVHIFFVNFKTKDIRLTMLFNATNNSKQQVIKKRLISTCSLHAY